MTTPLLLFVFAVTLALQTVPATSQFNDGSIQPFAYEAKFIESSNGTCPTAEEWEAVRNEALEEIQTLLFGLHTCGGTSGWTRIAYLDMSNSSHQCPGDLSEVTYEGIRLCYRDSRAGSILGICTSVTFTTNAISYNEVCGRIIGYHRGATGAFYDYTYYLGADNTIDEYYVDGVTLTHGPVGAREHIWTFVVGLDENLDNQYPQYACPCAPNADPSIVVPPFIGENYFCESGTIAYQGNVFHNEPLWDGDGCSEGNSCCTFNNPPYFTRQLPVSTSDDIELRNCGYYQTSGTFIQFIELYVK